MRKLQILILVVFSIPNVFGQENIKYYKFQTEIEESTRNQIFVALDSLLIQLTSDKLTDNYLSSESKHLTTSVLSKITHYETEKDSLLKTKIDKYLIRGYPINEEEYFLSLAFIQKKEEAPPTLYYIINLIATQSEEKIQFSIPLHYYTKDWKQTKIGSTTYHYKNKLKRIRAETFDTKNTLIANKLEVKKEAFDFYICENYQEIIRLLGIEFSIYENSKYRTGYGVVANTIFSTMNNEDFSHDVFHYYSGKINERKNRNWITEEGIAYLWGNAYYTNSNGEMITHQELVDELKVYLLDNPDSDLFDLFENNTKIFNHLAPEISVRSTLSGIIAKEVEKEKGMEGILKLINAGSQDRLESYLKVTNNLLGINKENFSLKVLSLINPKETK